MDITFSLQNGQYIAEFKVTSEFNLHIEKGVGSIQMFQRTSGTFFDKVEDFKMNKGDVVYDFDSSSFIGEKTIKIVSEVEPTFAAVTTSGEVTEIKSQSKEVEVTSNGTMDITPDAGFSYLNSVKVKTNVAQSGEGSVSSVEYLDVSGLTSSERIQIASIAILCKHTEFEQYGEIQDAGIAHMGSLVLLGGSAMAVLQNNVHAIMVDFSIKVTRTGEQGLFPIKETLFGSPVYDKLDSLPRITKEQFYNLNA